MRPILKWMIISLGGGLLITVALLLLREDLYIDIIGVGYDQLGAITAYSDDADHSFRFDGDHHSE